MDSSALVKLVIAEPGSEKVREIFRQASSQNICVSSLCVVETHSALSRLRELGEIEETERASASAYLMNMIANTEVRHFDRTVMHEALRIVQQRKLRALDAIQLATATLVGDMTFVASDEKLLVAAGEEGFVILNPATQH